MPAFCFVVCRRQWHVMEKKRNPDKSMRSCSSATTDAWHLCKPASAARACPRRGSVQMCTA